MRLTSNLGIGSSRVEEHALSLHHSLMVSTIFLSEHAQAAG